MTKVSEIEFLDGKELISWPEIHVTMISKGSRHGEKTSVISQKLSNLTMRVFFIL